MYSVNLTAKEIAGLRAKQDELLLHMLAYDHGDAKRIQHLL